MFFNKFIKRKKERGFTLVEMLVALAVFSIISVVIIGVFISTVRLQKHSLVSQQLLDQSSYAMEYMIRLVRMAKKEILESPAPQCLSSTGKNYETNVLIGGVGTMKILFRDYENKCKGFFIENGQLKEYEKGRTPNEVLDLTSDNLNVLNFEAYISGELQDDNIQPRVTLFLEIEGRGSIPNPRINLQATVSQRDLDVPE